MTLLSRRSFLGQALSVTAAASLPAIAAAGTAIKANPLADHVMLFTGAGANVIAARGPEGLLLVDGGAAEHSSSLLKAALREMSARRVHTLFNTHWHPEQTGSNERLGKADTHIIAHENTKRWLNRKIDVTWRAKSYGPLPPKALPTQTTYTTAKLDFGDEQIEYGYLPQAHTDGDIYVYLRKANVLAVGDAVTADRWPLIDWQTGGWIGGTAGGFSKLIALANDATRVVPANGGPLTRADLEQQREMYRIIYGRLVKSLASGLGPEEVVASAPTKEFHPEWGDPAPFVDMAFRSLWPHFAPDA
jgi:glyoxylase-like metal-dependent hydrolase (beta-lactamase superfamily II)